MMNRDAFDSKVTHHVLTAEVLFPGGGGFGAAAIVSHSARSYLKKNKSCTVFQDLYLYQISVVPMPLLHQTFTQPPFHIVGGTN
jgi:hypothetical protein